MADAKTTHKNSLKARFMRWLSVRTKKQKGFLWAVFVTLVAYILFWPIKQAFSYFFPDTGEWIGKMLVSVPFLWGLTALLMFVFGGLFATFLEEIWASIKRLFDKGGQLQSAEFTQQRLEALENVYHEGAYLLSKNPLSQTDYVWEKNVHNWNIKAEEFLNKFCPQKEARKYRMSPKIPIGSALDILGSNQKLVRIALEKRLDVLKEIVDNLS